MSMEEELIRHLLKKPVTLRYPFEKLPPVKGLRGKHVWDSDRCVGCGLCSTDCPSFAIEMIGKGLKAELKIYLGRCLFCGQCEEVCPVNAITMTEEYELASYDRAGMVIEFKREEKASQNLSQSDKNV